MSSFFIALTTSILVGISHNYLLFKIDKIKKTMVYSMSHKSATPH